MPTALAATLAAAHRMANGVLRNAALVRLAALPSLATRFAQADIHVHGIADRPDRGPAASDDAALCERLGYPVRVVPGSARNFKITTVADLLLAEALAAAENVPS